MAVTITKNLNTGPVRHVECESDLTPPVYFHWYLDGVWQGMTQTGEKDFLLAAGEQFNLVILDTVDPDFDYLANAPAGYPARRTIEFLESADEDTAYYLVQLATGASTPASNDWFTSENGKLMHRPGQWIYRHTTAPLDDLTWYWFSIVPYDAAGNAGSRKTIGREYVAHTPNAQDLAATFDPAGAGAIVGDAA